ncbi:proton-conducting transporter transmembrane domain-containing protein [Terricaulis silvestris]|uniref:NADH-quinone oxidoreductase subunit N n=1 Tax=Terricaulis silvestris TaxID=2686094 RepID=A0A6I6MQD4_9CAUL|nr:proton-conducting transporter membrane subunit [Terricaulis silvestris]QGZ95606.1 NADH-quinone oxidoreductase subunit N [Terricaulis silvestris]
MIAELLETARTNAPMLTLAVLFVGGACTAASASARVSWVIATLAATAAAVVAFDMGWRRLMHAARFGDAGIALSLDGVAAFCAPLIVAWLVFVVLSAPSALQGANARATPHLLALALCAAAGWVGALLSDGLLGVVLGVQIGWISSVLIVGGAGDADRASLNGALRMWSAGGAGAALMLMGAACLAYALGSGEAAAAASAHVHAPRLAVLGFVLMVAPLALYAGAAPLSPWAGATYGRASEFAVMVTTLGAIGALAVLARLAALASAAPAVAESLSAAFVVLGVASVAFGSIQAVGAVNVRRLVAYAGATQVGCILLAMALGSPAGFGAVLIQLFAWSAAALALLGGASVSKSSDLAGLDGLSRRAPLASVAVTAGALSLMGAPLTIGFLGRWRLIEASVGAGWWWAMGAAIAASLAAVFYGGRLIERVYFRRANAAAIGERDVWRFTRVPLLLAALGGVLLAFAPAVLLDAAARAAAMALGHAP